MKKNKLSVIAVILLALTAAYFIYTNNVGTIKKELKDFAVKDTASITKIFMADKEGESVLLEKKENGKWMVNNTFWAREDAIYTLLKTMYKVEVKSPVSKEAFNNVVSLLSGTGVKVEIYTNSKKPYKVYYVGNATSDSFGTYMLLENSSVPFVTHIPGFYGYLTPRYFTSEAEWRNTELFKYNIGDLKEVELMNHENPDASFKIENIDTEHPIVKSPITQMVYENIDTTNILGYLQLFENIHLEYYLNQLVSKEKQDSIIACCPKFDLTVTDVLGNKKTVRAFNKPMPPGSLDDEGKPLLNDYDKMYAVVNNGQDFVSIQYYVFDPLMQPLNFFLKKQKK
jgi:hypothetical protein